MLERSRHVWLAWGNRGTERPVVYCCQLTWDRKANVILTHCSGMHNRAFSGLLRGSLGAYLKEATWRWFDGPPSSLLLSNDLGYEKLSYNSCLPAIPLALINHTTHMIPHFLCVDRMVRSGCPVILLHLFSIFVQTGGIMHIHTDGTPAEPHDFIKPLKSQFNNIIFFF